MVALRPATDADAEALTALHIRSMFTAMPWLPVLHDHQATLAWMRRVVIGSLETRVAVRDGHIVGMAVLSGDWLDQLYVEPSAQGSGVGSALLGWAKAQRPAGLRLHTFTRNAPARAFYEGAGFVLVDESDGSGNEEREPDCTYAWQKSLKSPRPGTVDLGGDGQERLHERLHCHRHLRG